MEVVQLLIGAGGQRLRFLTYNDGYSPLHIAASRGHLDVSRLLVESLLAAKTNNCVTAEDVAMQDGHGALAGMLRGARVAKAGSDVRGQAAARPRVSAEVEELAEARAEAAMAELVAEEAKPQGAAGSAGGSGGGGAARGRKGRSGKKK